MKPGAEPSKPAQGSEWIVEVDVQSFEQGIIERSWSVPVLVDFWATWCGPCKTLGPELEKRAREGRGRFMLAKVDIDRNPELAQAFRVQAVPTVVAISRGKLVDGFQGALPGAELDRFIERVAPLGSGKTKTDERVERARAVAEEGRLEQGIGLLREILRDHPDHAEARLALVELLLEAKKAREARLVLEKLPAEGEHAARARALRASIDFAESAGDLAELEARASSAPDDMAARLELGRALIATQDHARGLEQLLEVVRRDSGDKRLEAKKAMLETFELLGLEDKLANEYRFKLSLELFS